MIRTWQRRNNRPAEIEAFTIACNLCLKAGDWRGALMYADLVWMRARQSNKSRIAEVYGHLARMIEAEVKAGKYDGVTVRDWRLSAASSAA